MSATRDSWLYDDDEFDELEERDLADDCMLMDDGQCMAAGSEWCEFECPYRDSELFAGSKAWIEKHKGSKP